MTKQYYIACLNFILYKPFRSAFKFSHLSTLICSFFGLYNSTFSIIRLLHLVSGWYKRVNATLNCLKLIKLQMNVPLVRAGGFVTNKGWVRNQFAKSQNIDAVVAAAAGNLFTAIAGLNSYSAVAGTTNCSLLLLMNDYCQCNCKLNYCCCC